MSTESTCSETLRQQGKPYPRTCRKCGLGPCIGKPVTTQPAQAGEPDAYLHDDGFWTAAKTDAGRQLNDRLLFAGSPKIGVFTTPPASQEQATDATILRYFAPWLPHPANDDDKQDLIKSARACFAKAPCGCRVGECESKADAHCRMTDEVHHQASQEPSGGEVVAWQPIETAPENTGGLVVVRWLDSDGAVCNELDHTDDGCWMGWHEHAEQVEIIGGHGVSYTPPYTHWMPLPDAPGITSTSTKEQQR